MKSSSMDTHSGSIAVGHQVIAQYAGTVATECFGVVGMAGVSVGDGIARLLKKSSMTRGIKVVVTQSGKLALTFHIVVAYGVSIRAVTDNLYKSVKYKVEEFTGMDVESIGIYVEGVRVID